jgi:hypothetical protein
MLLFGCNNCPENEQNLFPSNRGAQQPSHVSDADSGCDYPRPLYRVDEKAYLHISQGGLEYAWVRVDIMNKPKYEEYHGWRYECMMWIDDTYMHIVVDEENLHPKPKEDKP